MRRDPLIDKDFLKKLDLDKRKTIFARITSLNIEGNPVDRLEGRVTGGSISIDGSSTVRRTLNLTMVAHEMDINDYYWGMKSLIKVDIGLENNVDTTYENIIWFKQGIFVLTGFNTSQSTSACNISISGKDKMCLLNGDCGGALPASVDFGKIQVEEVVYTKAEEPSQIEFYADKYYQLVDDKYIPAEKWDATSDYYAKESNWTYSKLTLRTIIREAVHKYGKEKYSNIIINDLEDQALELLEYRGKEDLFICSHNGIYDGVYLQSELFKDYITVTNLEDEELEPDSDLFLLDDYKIITVYEDNKKEKIKSQERSIVRRYTYGDAIGYRATDFVYAGELVSSLGESITSILDKIKTMLNGDYEYFYDLDGHFVFQKTKTYINTAWNSILENNEEPYAEDAVANSSYTYSFENGVLITAFNNNPKLTNVKNDFSIWGQYKSASGANLAIHMRYAIDKKPTQYTTINITLPQAKAAKEALPQLYPGDAEKYVQESVTYSVAKGKDDWREIIYRMALDYYRYGQLDDFCLEVMKANGDLYPFGETGYEQYYEDVQGFWRQLFSPEPKYEWVYESKPNETKYIKVDNPKKSELLKALYYVEVEEGYRLATEWSEEETYYTKEETEWKIHLTRWDCNYFLSKDQVKKAKEEAKKRIDNLPELTDGQRAADLADLEKQIENNKSVKTEYCGWNLNAIRNPGALIFWMDFLDTAGAINKYSVKVIGDRAKTVNNDKITAINFRDVPSVLFMNKIDDVDEYLFTGYYKCALAEKGLKFDTSGEDAEFVVSAQGKSAKDTLDTMLYNYSYCPESVSITSLPVYYLEPNTRILVYDENSKINGEYIMSKYTLSLTYNGTMSITATKAAERLY